MWIIKLNSLSFHLIYWCIRHCIKWWWMTNSDIKFCPEFRFCNEIQGSFYKCFRFCEPKYTIKARESTTSFNSLELSCCQIFRLRRLISTLENPNSSPPSALSVAASESSKLSETRNQFLYRWGVVHKLRHGLNIEGVKDFVTTVITFIS